MITVRSKRGGFFLICHYSLISRYYQGCMDLDNLSIRQGYEAMKESYVIFICKGDPFKLGIPVYTVKNVFEERQDKIYDDFSRKVFYNASAWKKCGDDEVRAFLKYVATTEPSSNLTGEIDERVKVIRRRFIMETLYNKLINIQPFKFFADIQWEKMELREHIAGMEKIARREGHEKGLQEGLQEGRKEGREVGLQEGREAGLKEGLKEGRTEQALETARKLLSHNVSVDIISSSTGLTLEQVEALR